MQTAAATARGQSLNQETITGKNKNTIVLTKREVRKNKYIMSSMKGTGGEEKALETSITEKEMSQSKGVSRV